MTGLSFLAKFKPTKGVSKAGKFKLTSQFVLSLSALLILLADVWVVQSAVKTIYQYKFADVGAKTVQSTRVNFEAYNKAVDRIHAAQSYTPSRTDLASPFNKVEKLPED